MLKDIEENKKVYKCKEYEVVAHKHSCFFCKNCTDIFYDYTHGPYMFLCIEGQETTNGLKGKCCSFMEDE